MHAGGRPGLTSAINVTPLVDVVLVLLIIFMVVTPMLQRGKDVVLPKTSTADDEGQRTDPLVISMDANGQVYCEHAPCDASGMTTFIRDALLVSPARPLLFKGDARLEFGEVRRLVARAQQIGTKAIELAVEHKATP
jgi:biopolymer transport protein ExbD